MGSDWDPSTAWVQTPLFPSTPTAHPKDPAQPKNQTASCPGQPKNELRAGTQPPQHPLTAIAVQLAAHCQGF